MSASQSSPTRRRKSAKAGGQTRREELLDQVIDQLMTSGLNDVSLRQLAEAIGTSHRMLIYHFGTKEALVSDAVQEVRRRERVLFASLEKQHDGEDPTGPLRASFKHNTSVEMAPYFRLLYEVWGIALVHPERYGRFLEGIITTWVDAFAGVLRQAGIPSRDARVRATLVLGALRGLQLDLYTTRDRSRVDAAFAALLSMLEREIRDLEGATEPKGSPSTTRPAAGSDTGREDL